MEHEAASPSAPSQAPSQAPSRAPSREAVLGIDNIALDLPLAGIGSRSLAAAIDYAILTVLLPLALLVLALFGLAGFQGSWQIALAFLLVFVVYWGYFLLQEIFLDGRTFGKMAVRLRVVSRHGGGASWTQLVLRNLLRPIDMIVGMPLMAIDPLSRRLGDRVAGTLVLHDRQPEPREAGLRRIPAGWDARRVALAESLLRRAAGMAPEHRDALARRFLELVEQEDPELLDGAPSPGEDPLRTLRYALGMDAVGAG